MELTIQVDDEEGPFVIELLRKFSFVQEIKQNGRTALTARVDELWQQKAVNLFAAKADFDLWLSSPNSAINGQQPTDLLSNEFGYQSVQKLLGRLEHGIMA